jgi:hypothetical protein
MAFPGNLPASRDFGLARHSGTVRASASYLVWVSQQAKILVDMCGDDCGDSHAVFSSPLRDFTQSIAAIELEAVDTPDLQEL